MSRRSKSFWFRKQCLDRIGGVGFELRRWLDADMIWKDRSGNKIAGKQGLAWAFWDIPAHPLNIGVVDLYIMQQ